MNSSVNQGSQPYQPVPPKSPNEVEYKNVKKKYHRQEDECPQLPGTILRIFIPAGAVINLLNLLEVTSPSGICLIIRIPLLGGDGLDAIINSIKEAGGSVEFVKD